MVRRYLAYDDASFDPTSGQAFTYNPTTGLVEPATIGGVGPPAAPGYIRDLESPQDVAAWADEFDVDSLADYTEILPSGVLETAIGKGVLSLGFNAQASSDMAGVVRPIPGGLTKPWALQCSYWVWTVRANYVMAGPVLMDGNLETSNAMWWMPYWGDTSFNDSLRSGTPQNISTTVTNITRYPYGSMDGRPALVRMIVKADDTVTVERSLDGVLWSGAGATALIDRAIGFTPTHLGFGVSSWGANGGSTWRRLASVDYLRVYEL